MYMLVERQVEVYISENAPPSEPKVATTAEAIHWIRGLHNYDVIRVIFL